MGDKLKDMLAEYGATALVVYLVIFACTLLGFAAAIRAGVDVDSAGETAGLWFGAWLATKATQPLRIGATLLLTPIVATVIRKVTGRPLQPLSDAPAEPAPTADPEATPSKQD